MERIIAMLSILVFIACGIVYASSDQFTTFGISTTEQKPTLFWISEVQTIQNPKLWMSIEVASPDGGLQSLDKPLPALEIIQISVTIINDSAISAANSDIVIGNVIIPSIPGYRPFFEIPPITTWGYSISYGSYLDGMIINLPSYLKLASHQSGRIDTWFRRIPI